MIKVVCFDLWLTIAIQKHNMFRKLYDFLKPNMEYQKFSKIINKSNIMRKDICIEDEMHNIITQVGCDSNKYKGSVKIWHSNHKDGKLIKGAKEILQWIKKNKKRKLLLASSLDKESLKYLEINEPVLKYFDETVLSFKIGKSKPQKAFFQEIINITKCKPKEILFIGDSLDYDIFPANKIGFQTILLVHLDATKDYIESRPKNSMVAKSFKELKLILNKLL